MNNESTNVRHGMPTQNRRRQGIFWLLTIPRQDWNPPNDLPGQIAWLRGQAEVGRESGYEHWQLCVAFTKKKTLNQVKEIFGTTAHCELSRSESAADYCWKEDTRVPDSQFELGAKPIRGNAAIDWESVWTSAKSGTLEAIPAQVRVVSYRTLQAIASDYSECPSIERKCFVFWGKTGNHY